MKKILRYVMPLPLLAFAAIAFSGPAYAQESSASRALPGTSWELVKIQRATSDVTDVTGKGVTLRFGQDGRASGDSTCNSYSATYQAGPGQTFTFGEVASTLRACVDPALTAIETEYFSALPSVTQYSFDGDRLELSYNNGQSVLDFAPASAMTPGMPRTGGAGQDANPTPLLIVVSLAISLVLAGVMLLATRIAKVAPNRDNQP